MKNFARRLAVIVGAAAVSVGLMGAVAAPAHAGGARPADTSWGWGG